MATKPTVTGLKKKLTEKNKMIASLKDHIKNLTAALSHEQAKGRQRNEKLVKFTKELDEFRQSYEGIINQNKQILESKQALKIDLSTSIENLEKINEEKSSQISEYKATNNHLRNKLESAEDYEKQLECTIKAQKESLDRYRHVLEHHLGLYGIDPLKIMARANSDFEGNYMELVDMLYSSEDLPRIMFLMTLWRDLGVLDSIKDIFLGVFKAGNS